MSRIPTKLMGNTFWTASNDRLNSNVICRRSWKCSSSASTSKAHIKPGSSCDSTEHLVIRTDVRHGLPYTCQPYSSIEWTHMDMAVVRVSASGNAIIARTLCFPLRHGPAKPWRPVTTCLCLGSADFFLISPACTIYRNKYQQIPKENKCKLNTYDAGHSKMMLQEKCTDCFLNDWHR
jgi:hypothetical protein